MLEVPQTIYTHDVIVESKTNENAPKVLIYSLTLLNLTNAHIYLLLEAGTKLINLVLQNIEFKHSSIDRSLNWSISHSENVYKKDYCANSLDRTENDMKG